MSAVRHSVWQDSGWRSSSTLRTLWYCRSIPLVRLWNNGIITIATIPSLSPEIGIAILCAYHILHHLSLNVSFAGVPRVIYFASILERAVSSCSIDFWVITPLLPGRGIPCSILNPRNLHAICIGSINKLFAKTFRCVSPFF